jgi:DNA polymerase-3 subunit alpha
MIPLFKSHYSVGRSILTLSDDESRENYPDSIINIAKSNNLKELFLVEDNMTSFLEAYTNSKKYNIKLRYGLRITITDNYNQKDEASRRKDAKYIIFFKNKTGYEKMIKIFSYAAKDGFYYEPRIDYEFLNKIWDEKDLMLSVPFYDSFIFNNVLKGFICTPKINFTKPIFFIENNGLPFDFIVKNKIQEYIQKTQDEFLETKSIYYKNKSDFKTYLTFRCINSRTTLNKPEIPHMSSDEFSFESWRSNQK